VPVLCPAPPCLWKSFRADGENDSGAARKTVRLPIGIAVHVHPGILFTFAPERSSRSSRNRIHLPPESAARPWRFGKPHAPEPFPQRKPIMTPESVSVPCALPANARNVGRPSACQSESQAVLCRPSPVLLAPVGHRTDVTNYGQAEWRSHAALPKTHPGMRAARAATERRTIGQLRNSG